MTKDQDRYATGLAQVTRGVTFKAMHTARDVEPKALRVSIVAGAVDTAALLALLLEKKIISRAELDAARALEMERQVKELQKFAADLGLKATFV